MGKRKSYEDLLHDITDEILRVNFSDEEKSDQIVGDAKDKIELIYRGARKAKNITATYIVGSVFTLFSILGFGTNQYLNKVAVQEEPLIEQFVVEKHKLGLYEERVNHLIDESEKIANEIQKKADRVEQLEKKDNITELEDITRSYHLQNETMDLINLGMMNTYRTMEMTAQAEKMLESGKNIDELLEEPEVASYVARNKLMNTGSILLFGAGILFLGVTRFRDYRTRMKRDEALNVVDMMSKDMKAYNRLGKGNEN